MGLQNTLQDIRNEQQLLLAKAEKKAEKQFRQAMASRLKFYAFVALLILSGVLVVLLDYQRVIAPERCFRRCEKNNLTGFSEINCLEACNKKYQN